MKLDINSLNQSSNEDMINYLYLTIDSIYDSVKYTGLSKKEFVEIVIREPSLDHNHEEPKSIKMTTYTKFKEYIWLVNTIYQDYKT